MQTETPSLMNAEAHRLPKPPMTSQVLRTPHWCRSALERLFYEDPGVQGCGWFHRYREDPLHIYGNLVRVFCNIIFAPAATIPVGGKIAGAVYNFVQANWQGEHVNLPKAVLRNPPAYPENEDEVPNASTSSSATTRTTAGPSDDNMEVYEKTNFEPRWMLLVSIRDGQYAGHRQINWTKKYRENGYTTLSYNMEAAVTLFQEAGKELNDPKPDGNASFSLRDRRRISKQFLMEYCSAIRDRGESPDREEFIWLDEFCLSRERHTDEEHQDDQVEREEAGKERSEELGRLADIFGGAQTVVAFCNVVDCDHWTLDCGWGNRLFTLGEILHANEVRRMTRRVLRDDHGRESKQSYLYTQSARSFRERMMYHAAVANKWHLHSILRQSNNGGNDTWQMMIHALIVEAIRRDQETGYHDHELIGKGLNGLLPRRARLHHLKGKDGWADLAWLLELNQGFYNTAALAAMCRLHDKPEVGNGWLGPPIEPKAGNERLEPLVTAFTVSGKDKNGKTIAPLNIVDVQTIGLHPGVKRDSMALYRNPDARVMKVLSSVLIVLCWIIALALFIAAGATAKGNLAVGGFIVLWITSIAFNFFRLLIGAIYLEHSGWVFLSESKLDDGSKGDIAWGSNPVKVLQQLDPSVTRLSEWGDEQMVPTWDVPGSGYKQGHLVDLCTKIKVRVVVSKKPNAMVVLGVHGSGITYMLLDRPNMVNTIATKVGMASLPPFTLAATVKTGSVRVGSGGGIAIDGVPVSIWDKVEKVVKVGAAVVHKGIEMSAE
ncbi:hypothetical protein Moror_12994 [Moniliophthora roreri MCA 2997]|uniref:Heterokaryon incompatibility domain-containing protein n=1 Tax=Moniliophthora roreri (strain MCA 2997) TaxID=1381753 RepID=V2XJH3_MONRO|nr:hypothetical protein Moror_12994 [Moniliophthora roreri MCA 2997]